MLAHQGIRTSGISLDLKRCHGLKGLLFWQHIGQREGTMAVMQPARQLTRLLTRQPGRFPGALPEHGRRPARRVGLVRALHSQGNEITKPIL